MFDPPDLVFEFSTLQYAKRPLDPSGEAQQFSQDLRGGALMPAPDRVRWRFIASILSVLIFLPPDYTLGANRYSWVEIGPLPAGSGIIRGLSDNGDVAGRSGYLHGTKTRAFVQTAGGTTEQIGVLLGGENSRAIAVNNYQQVVGFSNTQTSIRAFLWSQETGVQDLGTLPGDSSSKAYAINDANQIVGSSSGAGGIRAFLWNRNGGMREITGLPGADYTEALAINSSGQIVGASGNSRIRHAFLWTPSGGTQDLGILPNDVSSAANAINDYGKVVGVSVGPYGSRAFIWTSSEGMRDLGALPGATETEAIAVNNRGDVVGASGDGVSVRAFLWISSSGIQDLNAVVPADFPVVLEGAFGINNRGQIIAIGNVINMPGQDRSGAQLHHSTPNRMFLLTPRSKS
jgi:probable HAF family extracellular repeat protein